MVTQIKVDVPKKADYKVRILYRFANGDAGFKWTRTYLWPGEMTKIYINSLVHIDSIKQVPLDTPES